MAQALKGKPQLRGTPEVAQAASLSGGQSRTPSLNLFCTSVTQQVAHVSHSARHTADLEPMLGR